MKKLFPFLVLLCGCASGVKQLGTVGNVKYYSVKSQSVFGPNISMIVSERGEQVSSETAASCTGIGGAVIQAAGNVGASAALGLSLRPDRYNNNNSTSSDSNAAASGSGAVSPSYTRVNGNSANAPGHNK